MSNIKRWFAHYHMPVIRYWNPELKVSVQHSKSLSMEPRIILDFGDEQNVDNDRNDGEGENEENVNRGEQVLKAYNFASDELFEQLMKVEKGADAQQLQDSLRQVPIEKEL